MSEQEVDVYKAPRERLRILDNNLRSRGLRCDIELMGVSHAGEPDEIVLDRVKRADVVTLELTRQVVQTGLRGDDSRILGKNPFWRTIVESLRPDLKNKRVRGVEVNQTPRVAWKRFSLHYENPTLSPSPLTIEVERDNITDLDELLNENELKALQTYNWLVTESPQVACSIYKRSSEVIRALKDEEKVFPVKMAPGISLVCSNIPENPNTSDNKITFMTPPHPSLIKAFELIKRALGDLNLLEDREINGLAFDIMLAYLLSPAELTEVREIAYVGNQYIRSDIKPGQKGVTVVHIGGAYHTPVLKGIFDSSLPINSGINVSSSYDSKCAYLEDLWSFFRDRLPFDRRMAAVRVTGFETQVIPELIGQDIVTAIVDNRDDFNERLAKYRASRQLEKG